MLFQWDLAKDAPDIVERLFWSNTRRIEDDALRGFSSELFRGAVAASTEIDALIATHAANWRMDRMAAVDRNLLRLAIFEMMVSGGTPPAVIINEALEIARRFSSEDSVQFINGVLDSVRKALEAPRPA